MTDSLQTSGLVVVDKPAGMTSHDVVAHVRKAVHTRRVGHAGTLDPLATGVLVVGVERGTKFLAHMTASTKAYEATIRLGQASTTDDLEGELGETTSTTSMTHEQIDAALSSLRGDILQRPASVSAIKVNGQRAYALARAGKAVDLPERAVHIDELSVRDTRREGPFTDLDVTIRCSSGTYIRSIARDLGEALGCGGHLTYLRRTEVGPFTLGDARTLNEFEAHPALSLSLDEALLRCYPAVAVSEQEALGLSQGKWLEPRGLEGIHAAVAPDGHVIALLKDNGKRLASVFVARPITLTDNATA